MMDLKLIILLLLAAESYGQPPFLLSFKRCGHITCVDQPEVICDHSLGRCQCPAPLIGNPRYFCTRKTQHYLCLIHDDPHMQRFNGNEFPIPLPCAHKIADLITPKTFITPTMCNVIVIGRAKYPLHRHHHITASYENSIHFKITTAQSSFTAILDRNTPPVTNKNAGADATYTELTNNEGVFILIVPQCGLTIMYNSQRGDLTIVTPIKTVETVGLCGHTKDCEGDGYHRYRITNYVSIMELVFASLHYTSPVDGSNINIYESCTNLTDRIQTCQRKRLARRLCGLIVAHGPVMHCMQKHFSATEILNKFYDCYDNACYRPKKQCSIFVVLFGPCLKQRAIRMLNRPRTCSPVILP